MLVSPNVIIFHMHESNADKSYPKYQIMKFEFDFDDCHDFQVISIVNGSRLFNFLVGL